MTARLPDREIARLRRLARGDKPDETTTFEWYCEVCGNGFRHHGITSVCQRCTDAGIEELGAGVSGG